MSDQYGSFDNPYGGKPPFQGQEPPPPTPYASPQPYAVPQPTQPTQPQQPQGWGQAPPAYGQYAMGQQPPAYLRPYYPQPDPDTRPGTVVAASIMTIVGSVIALLISLFMVPAGIADYNDPSSSDKGVTLAMVIWFAVCGVLSLIAIPLGIMVLFRSKVARVLLTVVGSIAALLSLFVVVFPALIIAAIVMLYAGRAGTWFARRTPGDPWQQPAAAVPGPTPPTHQQF
ncbi:serine/arginine repetitive matrix protein 2 [Nocardioidaceae bacterium Broad-1]|nr:serine/arginine repetitive matrix protein 2 [Nocardioidaceae bacterium Broad-1]